MLRLDSDEPDRTVDEDDARVFLRVAAIAARVARSHGAAATAEDLGQDVALELMPRIRAGEFRGNEDGLAGLAYVVAERRLVDAQRSRAAERERERLYALETGRNVGEWADPEIRYETGFLGRLFDRTLAGLSLGPRRAFHYVRERGMDYREAADCMSISPSTVRQHLIRALATFRIALDANGIINPPPRSGGPGRRKDEGDHHG